MDTTFYDRLFNVIKAKAPETYARDAVQQLKNEHSYHSDYKLGLHDQPYFPERYGVNLTSQPDMYLPPSLKSDAVSINKELPYNTGGQFSTLAGIQLNPRSMFDKSAALVHEARHYQDAFTPLGDYYDTKRLSKEDQKAKIKSNDATFNSIKDKLIKFKNADSGYRSNRILSGQTPWDEIKAQLVSYEAMLPAGMKLEQSPLGKAALQTPEEKLWYINHTQPSMSDQSYLEQLMQRK